MSAIAYQVTDVLAEVIKAHQVVVNITEIDLCLWVDHSEVIAR